MTPGRQYFYDFSEDFKNGGTLEVRVLYWYTVDGTPKAVVEVLNPEDEWVPRDGEIRKIGLGPSFFSVNAEDPDFDGR